MYVPIKVSHCLSPKQQETSKHWEPYGENLRNIFMPAVATALPGVEFCKYGPHSAWVYYPGDTHVLGVIVVDTTASAPRFGLESGFVMNTRYREANPLRNRVWSKNLSTAVHNAKTYLRRVPYTAANTAEWGSAYNAMSTYRTKKLDSLRQAYFEIFKIRPYDFSALWSPGVEFLHGEYEQGKLQGTTLEPLCRAFFSQYFEAEGVDKMLVDRPMLVRATTWHGETLLEKAAVEGGDVVSVPLDEASEHVRGALAVLGMVEPLHYVHGVGVKIDDRVFYITRGV